MGGFNVKRLQETCRNAHKRLQTAIAPFAHGKVSIHLIAGELVRSLHLTIPRTKSAPSQTSETDGTHTAASGNDSQCITVI